MTALEGFGDKLVVQGEVTATAETERRGGEKPADTQRQRQQVEG